MKRLFLSLAIASALSATPLVSHAQLRVGFAPPAPRVEVRGVAPSPRHVWIGGHWRWEGGRHVWWPGRWELGRPGHVWVDARWVNEGGQWVFQPGRWEPIGVAPAPVVVAPAPVVAPPGEVVVQTAPPPPPVEVVPVAPSPRHFWVAGHWKWEGRWVWVPGHHELRRAGGFWEPAHWAQGPGGYHFVPGHWR